MSEQKETIYNLLPDYLDGTLEQPTKAQLEQLLQDPRNAKVLEAYQSLYTAFKNEPQHTPSFRVREAFLEQLAMEKAQQATVIPMPMQTSRDTHKNWFWPFAKVAASIALLITAFFMGRYQGYYTVQKDMLALKETSVQLRQTTMISLLENQSASKRIQGVAYIEDFEQPDKALVKALADRMLHDDNTNVRWSAMEALVKFRTAPEVKRTFIKALETEQNPSIQIAIIQNLVELQEKEALDTMKTLLEQEETQPYIKDELEQAITKII
ncbi:MAG: HEAT repeat domain-containing protein [Bacteroidota bacterium]